MHKMPNDKEIFTFGSVTVDAWPTGWQKSPHTDGEVFGATAHFMRGPSEYFGRYYGSTHDAEHGVHPVLADVVAAVADDLVSFDNDPDEFISMILEGITADTFNEKAKMIHNLEKSTFIAGELSRWLEDSDFETFEEWGEA